MQGAAGGAIHTEANPCPWKGEGGREVKKEESMEGSPQGRALIAECGKGAIGSVEDGCRRRS